MYSIPAENTSFCGVGPGRIYNGKNGIPFSRYPCRFWDNYDSVFPSLEDSGTFGNDYHFESYDILEIVPIE
jgi:hypothetical protein